MAGTDCAKDARQCLMQSAKTVTDTHACVLTSPNTMTWCSTMRTMLKSRATEGGM